MKAQKAMMLAVVGVLVTALPAMAAEGTTRVFSGGGIGVGIGVAITMLGAALGFGKIGAAALESMARQPEVADRVRGTMIVIAALLEGATFFALLVCLIMVFTAGGANM